MANIYTFSKLKNNYVDDEDLRYSLFSTNIVTNNIDYSTMNECVIMRDDVMRIDTLMRRLYGNNPYAMQYLDIILKINNIDNPFNLNEGQVIYYPPMERIEMYTIEESDDKDTTESIRNAISTPSKQRYDKNRKEYVDSYSLPPTMTSESEYPIKINDNKIVISQK